MKRHPYCPGWLFPILVGQAKRLALLSEEERSAWGRSTCRNSRSPCGMRPSEQYGLDWTKVDLTRNFVSLPKTKTGKPRHIPLNAVAVAAFKVLQQRSLDRQWSVFVNIEGQPLRGYKYWFDRAVDEAGVRDFTWYCLRHTFASRLAMAGVGLLTIAELMGYRTIQMTKRYAHLAPGHNQAAVDRLLSFQTAPEPRATDRIKCHYRCHRARSHRDGAGCGS
jgi:integrase